MVSSVKSVAGVVLLVVAVALTTGGRSCADDSNVLSDQVAKILSQHCLRCHNNQQSEGDLSLVDLGEVIGTDSTQSDDQWILVKPNDPAASPLLDVVTPVDGEHQMPKGDEPLESEQIVVLHNWIKQGAPWDDRTLREETVQDFDWWSYRPLKRPAIPSPQSNGDSDRLDEINVIDRFITRRSEEQGLIHNPPADRRTLLRRLSFDLTGLPPGPLDVAQFQRDTRPDAYERQVDRMLSSPAFGERWARHWLDVVQYADTCGYDKDKLRPNAWPYRDYVINAMNHDKPYTRFVQEQVAGDVLFPGTRDGILGLGFVAAGPWDFIGHVEVPESKIDGKVARNLDRDNMVTNTFNTFCSVTIQCARCHHHKFDPITQQQYYGAQALFASVDRAERPYDLDPVIEQKRRSLRSKRGLLKGELGEVEKRLANLGGKKLASDRSEFKKRAAMLAVEKSQRYGFHSQIAGEANQEKWVEIKLSEATVIERVVLHACHDDFAGIGMGFGFPRRFHVEVLDAASGNWSTVMSTGEMPFANPGLIPVEVALRKPIETVAVRVVATELAERKNDYIFALAEVRLIGRDGQPIRQDVEVTALDSIESSAPELPPGRWAKRNLIDGEWPKVQRDEEMRRVLDLKRSIRELEEELADKPDAIRRGEINRELRDIDQKLSGLPEGKLVYAAATHFEPQSNFKPTEGKPRNVHVLHRGDVQHPVEQAVPGTLSVGNPRLDAPWRLESSKTDAERRAALAYWLTDHGNPLLWRSIANRIWQYHFGQGLVTTPNDFGRMGAVPSHPELLDWLACEIRDTGSLKRIHRLIVTSGVYRQSSDGDARNLRIDKENRFLWRFNRRRLSAEEIRDSILVVSRRMRTEMGGPGYFLFELEKTDHSPHYEYHKFDPTDAETFKRSIYRFIVRSQPDPWMTNLDCADSSQSTPRRTETTTPLQALTMWNGKFSLAMAEELADELRLSRGTLEEQIDLAFRSCFQRKATPDESDELKKYAAEFGLANLCRLFFNFNEFLFVD